MTDLVTLRRDGNIGVIVIDNPPVNAFGAPARAGVLAALLRARDTAAIEAIVLRCAGRTFIAGADITEFGKPPQSPTFPEVIAAIEACEKPVVAAMHGTALGGGLEVALGCHYRIAAPGTRLALPEIKLGLIPGAGGTQRLPRLVGVEKGLAMILSGDLIPVEEAHAAGLVDAIVDDPDAGAVAFAREIAQRRPLPRARDKVDGIASFVANPAAFDAIAAPFLKRAKGLNAPAAAIDAIRGGLTLTFDEALARERAIFVALRDGEQSKALRHIFFAERAAAKVDLPAGVKPRKVARAAIIGVGTMGGGIAMCFANAGIPVSLVEVSGEALARGRDAIERTYRGAVVRGSLAPEEMDRRLGLIEGTTDMGAVARADLVIEAVFEDIEVKRKLFADLDRLAKPGTVLATNTSYLDVNAIAQVTERPQDVLGLHFFSPANVMRLVEVVRAEKTAPDALATAVAVARAIGKAPVVVGVCHGFVGNRMLRLRTVEAERLLLEGALPQDVDDALTAFGFAMGPFAVSDLAGLDIAWRMRKAQGLRAEIADRLCELGRFGQKTGRGFYLYEPGSRTPKPDPEVERLIVETAARLGIARAPIAPDEIVERLLFPMINEGARILEEGIAKRPGDIDVIWVNGYGFPAWRGGPMHYADTLGLGYVHDRLIAFAAKTGDERHRPSAQLERLAAVGKGFAALSPS
ncbi:MAG: 3-hydroxyacyl-CoA dehydrogenase NAD-binding domain-containing protein [Rhodoplanes sp.]